MSHDTETGSYDEDVPILTEIRGRSIHAKAGTAQSLSVDQSDKSDRSVNKALPWCVLSAAAAFLALGIVISDHSRIGDSIEHQATLIHNAENRAIDGQNMGLIAEQKCNSLEIEMARHGVVAIPLVKK